MAVKKREMKECSACGRVNRGDKVVASHENGKDDKGNEVRLKVACPYIVCEWCGSNMGSCTQ